MGLELEVDEGLHVARLNLDDDEDDEDDEEGFDQKWTLGDECLGLLGQGLGHEVEQIAEEHKCTNCLVGSAPLEEYLRFKLVEYLMEHLLGNPEGGGTEEHPTGGNEVESNHPTYQPTHWAFFSLRIVLAGKTRKRTEYGTEGVPDFIETEEHAVDAAPEDEVEGRAMPKTAEKHGHEEVEILTELAVTVAAKGDVEVVLEPRGEADVPASPKLSDGGGAVGVVEVLGELEAEQEGDADCHVGVA